ncbi:hypothetical protein F4780DRAFT_770130 [Xylariomycetidae sp. FL0641]|nr:hypothetical protein F4780DRAFT_770130 [Xylariomycetidae sp. FL0641]
MPVSLVGAPRGLKVVLLIFSFFGFILALAALYHGSERSIGFIENVTGFAGGKTSAGQLSGSITHSPPKYKPTPTYAVAAVSDPFPLLAESTATPPPIPAYNVPRPDLYREYGLTYMPPLFIGFTRQWPMLLQCVVSYITAGWPPESIYVVENTGVQHSNVNGKLGLQNPFYLNHTTLRRLGVNVLPTPVLLTFSQMQNFFLSTALSRSWPYYFYSHQDVIVLSFEDGVDTRERPGDRAIFFYDEQDAAEMLNAPPAGQPGYRSLYENCLRELNQTVGREERWGFRWFQYDHLTLVNRAALDAVGGWDSLMPYYGSDCDMNARLEMDGWSMRHRRAGIINDVSSVMDDLAALYRDPGVVPKFVDPNPVPEEELDQLEQPHIDSSSKRSVRSPSSNENSTSADEEALSYFRTVLRVADEMGEYKYRTGDKSARNSWQTSQHGGAGEPYHYDAVGFTTAFWVLAEAGREVFRLKWGHRDCNLVEETALGIGDQWRVEKDWED